MKILNFKLINGGRDGIEIKADEHLDSGKFKIVDKVNRTRKIPLSDSLIEDIRQLKYYFLNLTGHWIPPYSNYYDTENKQLLPIPTEGEVKKIQLHLRDLWNKTEITGATSKNGGFVITGKIETVEGKYIGLATPLITSADDVSFYSECMEILNGIADGIVNYISTYQLSIESQQKLFEQKDLDSMSKDDIAELAIEKLQARGAIIMMSDASEIPDHIEGKTISDKHIDGNNVVESEEVDEVLDFSQQQENQEKENQEPLLEDEIITPVIQIEKNPNPFGLPAATLPVNLADSTVSEVIPDNIQAMEYSESMGEPTQNFNEEEPTEPQETW